MPFADPFAGNGGGGRGNEREHEHELDTDMGIAYPSMAMSRGDMDAAVSADTEPFAFIRPALVPRMYVDNGPCFACLFMPRMGDESMPSDTRLHAFKFTWDELRKSNIPFDSYVQRLHREFTTQVAQVYPGMAEWSLESVHAHVSHHDPEPDRVIGALYCKAAQIAIALESHAGQRELMPNTTRDASGDAAAREIRPAGVLEFCQCSDHLLKVMGRCIAMSPRLAQQVQRTAHTHTPSARRKA